MTRFDEEFSRFNTSSVKWDEMTKEEKENGMLPFWIADSDYKTEKSITDALINRASHEAYAYTFPSDDYFKSIIKWGQDTKGVKQKNLKRKKQNLLCCQCQQAAVIQILRCY